jgi:hypothetical protein
MNKTADDSMDAIVTALERLGEDGHGKNGLQGRMFMMARFNAKRFAIFLERALRVWMNAKPGKGPTVRKAYLTYDEVAAELRERGIPLQIMKYLGPEEVPAELLEGVRPSDPHDLTEAVIAAAIRHGSDGHGENGLMGYVVQLERTEPKNFDRLIGLAQQWQAARPKQPEKRVYPTLEEIDARMRELGMDIAAIDKILLSRSKEWPRT